ncbi:TonB family protein [Paraglaciecola aestuariivivens]
MINWLIEQQLPISLLLLVLIGLEAKGIKKLGANIVYALWLLVPLLLIATNLPQNVIAVSDQSIYSYLVKVNSVNQVNEFSINWDMLWIAGCLAILTIATVTQWQIHRISKLGEQDLRLKAKLPKSLSVVSNQQFSGPVLTGIFTPTLLIPKDFYEQFSQRQQDLIIAHELVHLRRHDNLFNLLALIFVAVFWFNPIAWLAYRAFRRSQELACDQAVLQQANKQDKITYSRALVQCAEHALHSFSIYSPYGEKNNMLKRINSIQHPATIKPALVGLCIALGSTMLAGVAFANMADKAYTVEKGEDARPVIRIEPKYPVEAAKNKQEGSVILQFDIAKDGSTDNIEVIESFPAQVFDKVSIAALEQWTYKPRIQGGQAQRQTGVKVQLDYRLDAPYQGQTAGTAAIEKIKVQH